MLEHSFALDWQFRTGSELRIYIFVRLADGTGTNGTCPELANRAHPVIFGNHGSNSWKSTADTPPFLSA